MINHSFYVVNRRIKFETIIHLVGHKDVEDICKCGGLFDGISYAFNWLFGTPDANYAKSINNLTTQNHDIQLLIKQQVHIISDAIKNCNTSATSLRIKEKKLNSNIGKCNKFGNTTNNYIQTLERYQAITDYLSLLSQIISELNVEHDIQNTAMLFSKQNIIHPSIITLISMRTELLKVKFSADAQFPTLLNDLNNAIKYFAICDLTVIYNHW